MRRRVVIRIVRGSVLAIGLLAGLLVGCGGGSSGGCDFDGEYFVTFKTFNTRFTLDTRS